MAARRTPDVTTVVLLVLLAVIGVGGWYLLTAQPTDNASGLDQPNNNRQNNSIQPIQFDIADGSSASIYLTANSTNDAPGKLAANQFACKDKIYAVLESSGFKKTSYLLEAEWFGPSGKRQEYTRYEFNGWGGPQRLWVWLELHSPPEAALAKFVNPGAGYEDFIGGWKLKIKLNSKTVATSLFEVSC